MEIIGYGDFFEPPLSLIVREQTKVSKSCLVLDQEKECRIYAFIMRDNHFRAASGKNQNNTASEPRP